MEDFAVDLDKVLDDFELSEDTQNGSIPGQQPTGFHQFKDHHYHAVSHTQAFVPGITTLQSTYPPPSHSQTLPTTIYGMPYGAAERFDISDADFAPSPPRSTQSIAEELKASRQKDIVEEYSNHVIPTNKIATGQESVGPEKNIRNFDTSQTQHNDTVKPGIHKDNYASDGSHEVLLRTSNVDINKTDDYKIQSEKIGDRDMTSLPATSMSHPGLVPTGGSTVPVPDAGKTNLHDTQSDSGVSVSNSDMSEAPSLHVLHEESDNGPSSLSPQQRTSEDMLQGLSPVHRHPDGIQHVMSLIQGPTQSATPGTLPDVSDQKQGSETKVEQSQESDQVATDGTQTAKTYNTTPNKIDSIAGSAQPVVLDVQTDSNIQTQDHSGESLQSNDTGKEAQLAHKHDSVEIKPAEKISDSDKQSETATSESHDSERTGNVDKVGDSATPVGFGDMDGDDISDSEIDSYLGTAQNVAESDPHLQNSEAEQPNLPPINMEESNEIMAAMEDSERRGSGESIEKFLAPTVVSPAINTPMEDLGFSKVPGFCPTNNMPTLAEQPSPVEEEPESVVHSEQHDSGAEDAMDISPESPASATQAQTDSENMSKQTINIDEPVCTGAESEKVDLINDHQGHQIQSSDEPKTLSAEESRPKDLPVHPATKSPTTGIGARPKEPSQIKKKKVPTATLR